MSRKPRKQYLGRKSGSLLEMLLLLLISGLILSSCKATKQKGQTEINSDPLSLNETDIEEPELDNIRINPEVISLSGFGSPDEMISFYTKRDKKLAWIKKGKLSRNAKELLSVLNTAWKDGLSPSYYPLSEIDELTMEFKKKSMQNSNITDVAIKLDMLLTQVYFDYASDIAEGRHTPTDLKGLPEIHPHKLNLSQHLEEALQKRRIVESIESLAPSSKQYAYLKESYQKLYLLNKEKQWPLPGYFSTIHPGDSADQTIDVKKYLVATGDLLKNDSAYLNSQEYDNDLKLAVEEFQKRHGLKTDGIIGKKTQEEMNKPIEYRLEQMQVNLDRLRWENQHEKVDNFILVNIPEFTLTYFKDARIENQMNVVVGQNDHYTPILKDTVTYLVFNPNWNVPRSIATKEMLPKIKKDSTYLERNNYVLLNGSYLSNDTIDPRMVNWDNYSTNSFPYFIVQKPGSYNALGKIKFMMPNEYSVYLHDTSARHLFQREERNFSHGCIRLERPIELAENLLNHQLSSDSINQILRSKKRKVVPLEEPVPVQFVYHTAWSDFRGKLHFRKDIYGYDQQSIHQLQKLKMKNKLLVQNQPNFHAE